MISRRDFLKRVTVAGITLPGIIGCGAEGDIGPNNYGSVSKNKNVNIIKSNKKFHKIYDREMLRGVIPKFFSHYLDESIVEKKDLEHMLIGSTSHSSPVITKPYDDNIIRYSINSNNPAYTYLIRKSAKQINRDTPLTMTESNNDVNVRYNVLSKGEYIRKNGKTSDATIQRLGPKTTSIDFLDSNYHKGMWGTVLQENINLSGYLYDVAEFTPNYDSNIHRTKYSILDDEVVRDADPNKGFQDFDLMLYKIITDKSIISNKTTPEELIKNGVVDRVWEEHKNKYNLNEKYTDSSAGYNTKDLIDSSPGVYTREELLDLNEHMIENHPNYENLSIRKFHDMSMNDKSATIVKSYCSFPEKFNYLS